MKIDQVELFNNPKTSEAVMIIKGALNRRLTLIINGACEVDYEGRASSRLELGCRLILIKRDGTVLIHRDTGYEPINWMPPGCLITLKGNGALSLKVIRRKPYEALTIIFSKIFFIAMPIMLDKAKFSLYATERDMQNAIMLEPKLIEEGFKPLSREEALKKGLGFVDLIGEDAERRLIVIEIKRERADKEAVLQLKHYVNAVRSKTKREVRGVLVAPGLASGAQKLMETLGYMFKKVNPHQCAEMMRRKRVEQELSKYL